MATSVSSTKPHVTDPSASELGASTGSKPAKPDALLRRADSSGPGTSRVSRSKTPSWKQRVALGLAASTLFGKADTPHFRPTPFKTLMPPPTKVIDVSAPLPGTSPTLPMLPAEAAAATLPETGTTPVALPHASTQAQWPDVYLKGMATSAERVASFTRALDAAFDDPVHAPYKLVNAVLQACKANEGSLDAAPSEVMQHLFSSEGAIDIDGFAKAMTQFSHKSIFDAFNHASWIVTEPGSGDPIDHAENALKTQDPANFRPPTAEEALAVNAARYIFERGTQSTQRQTQNKVLLAAKLSTPPIFIREEGWGFRNLLGARVHFGESSSINENRHMTTFADFAHQQIVHLKGINKSGRLAQAICVASLHELSHAKESEWAVAAIQQSADWAFKGRAVDAATLREIKKNTVETLTEGIATHMFTFHTSDSAYEKGGSDEAFRNVLNLIGPTEEAALKTVVEAWLTDNPEPLEKLFNGLKAFMSQWATRFPKVKES
jgi:hypothetical protein